MTKYSVALILFTHDTNAKNQHPVYIRITIDRKVKYIATGYFISPKIWDSKNETIRSGPNAELINADIYDRKQKIIKHLVEKNLKSETVTAAQVKELFMSGKNLHNYFDFADSFIREMKNKRTESTLENYRKHNLRLELYHGSKDLSFEQIDRNFLVNYEQRLRETVGENYTHSLFKTLRTFFNAAITREIITHYPFTNYEGPKYTAPEKDYLSLAELKKVETLITKTKNPVIKATAVYFLLGCYTGLRISDWAKFDLSKNVQSGRLYLRATKNNEWVTMPVTGRLKKHLPWLAKVKLAIAEPTINEKLKEVARLIKTDKHLTSHTGRHTFAITMCAEQGISSETCAELMGITVKTCVENYYRVTNRKIDKETIHAWEGL